MQEFNGYCGMDEEQYWRGAYTRVSLAEQEIHNRPRRHVMFGNERFNEDVWKFLGRCNARQGKHRPNWEKVDEQIKQDPRN